MGQTTSDRVIRPEPRPFPFPLPALRRRRPRSYTEWRTLRQWGELSPEERRLPGYLLRLARERAGLTQHQMAERLGCSQQAVSQAERWESNPTVDFLETWARAAEHEPVLDLAPISGRRPADPERTAEIRRRGAPTYHEAGGALGE
ncbi:MAG: helix-turn-helix transcriptional regulator [Thermoanaerobaculia bacterium]|nr:helix-turn-helix transcriptional regulator [Thermoanaerobaculia bacterium]